MDDDEKKLPSDEKIRKKFKQLSPDHGHSILKSDVKKLIQVFGQNPSNKQVTDALVECDLASSKVERLTFEDFKVVLWTVWNEIDLENDLRRAFTLFDADHNGYLDENEFKTMMLSYGETFTLGELDEMMKIFDTNTDRRIDYEEFVKAMTCGEVDLNESAASSNKSKNKLK